jgi:hypothetical protein
MTQDDWFLAASGEYLGPWSPGFLCGGTSYDVGLIAAATNLTGVFGQGACPRGQTPEMSIRRLRALSARAALGRACAGHPSTTTASMDRRRGRAGSSRTFPLAFTARRQCDQAPSVILGRATAPRVCHSPGPGFEQSRSSAPA